MTVRPRIHFTPAKGWMNDPHGLVFHEGRYHLFFQCVPDSLDWGQECHWGHATSADLLHWEWQPTALFPGDGDTGCWSGSLVVAEDGEPLLFYTAVGEPDLHLGAIRLARSSDDAWLEWRKGEVVARSSVEGTTVFRDPQVFRDGAGWRMIVGVGRADGTAGADVFRSDDLLTWEYDGQLAARHGTQTDPWTGLAWECPQLLRTGRDDALVVSVWKDNVTHNVAAAAGSYADGRFDERSWHDLTVGEGHYAASAFTDADGRACLLFWIRGVGEPGKWTGVLSVPYLVSVDRDRVRLAVHPAVAGSRTSSAGAGPGTALDIEWRPGRSGRLTLAGRRGRTCADLTLAEGLLTVTVPGAAPVTVAHSAPELRVLVDGPVLEVVADGGLVGLPLAGTAGGVTPSSDQPLEWWHLR